MGSGKNVGPIAHLCIHHAQVDGPERADSSHPTVPDTNRVQAPAKQAIILTTEVHLMSPTLILSIEKMISQL